MHTPTQCIHEQIVWVFWKPNALYPVCSCSKCRYQLRPLRWSARFTGQTDKSLQSYTAIFDGTETMLKASSAPRWSPVAETHYLVLINIWAAALLVTSTWTAHSSVYFCERLHTHHEALEIEQVSLENFIQLHTTFLLLLFCWCDF